ncbi:MAG: type II toxin-antitoxin system VapC family toxin [Bacillota bacterium]|nr:type II toxin-antitoxin system VapC family toxin [Bacillota bacterium]
MTDKSWIDANVIIRFITKDPEEMAAKALNLMLEAERGNVSLYLASLTLAEVVWTLESFYGYQRKDITEVLSLFLQLKGLKVEQEDILNKALEDYSSKNIDFVDAYLAARASLDGPGKIFTFDRKHFSRLSVSFQEPGSG